MPRCNICNRSSETDSQRLRFTKEDQGGHICEDCEDIINETIFSYIEDEPDEDSERSSGDGSYRTGSGC